MSGLFSLLFVGIGMVSVVGIKHMWPDYKDDNIVEECAEKVLKSQTNIDIDLTPSSSEEATKK